MNKLGNIGRWNWGAFLLCPFWCIRYQVWIGMTSIIPILLILLMSLFSLIGYYGLVLMTEHKLSSVTQDPSSPIDWLISMLPFGLLYLSAIIFDSIGKDTTIWLTILFYHSTSFFIGLNGNKLALSKIKTQQQVQEFYLDRHNWQSVGILLSIPVNIILFCVLEKSISISVHLLQLPGI
jgi:hypothetical protein